MQDLDDHCIVFKETYYLNNLAHIPGALGVATPYEAYFSHHHGFCGTSLGDTIPDGVHLRRAQNQILGHISAATDSDAYLEQLVEYQVERAINLCVCIRNQKTRQQAGPERSAQRPRSM